MTRYRLESPLAGPRPRQIRFSNISKRQAALCATRQFHTNSNLRDVNEPRLPPIAYDHNQTGKGVFMFDVNSPELPMKKSC